MPETRREALESAFENYDENDVNAMAEELVEPSVEPDDQPEPLDASDESSSEKSQRVRDEKGRFTKQATQVDNEGGSASLDLESISEANTDIDSQTIDPQLDELIQNRPSSFKSEAVWRKLVEGTATQQDQRYLAKYYIDRENDFHKGIGEYKLAAEKNYYLADAIEQYIPLLQQQRIDPGQFIRNLANTHYQLSTGSQEQKLAVLYQAARDYGVNLVQTDQGVALAPMHPNEQYMTQQMQEFKREIDAMKRLRENETRSNIQAEINRLVADKQSFPYFNDLREDMALLLESGHSTTFESAYAEAYRRATRFSNVARPQTSTPQLVRKAKQTAVSPKSGSPTAPPSSKNSHMSRREHLESAFDQYS